MKKKATIILRLFSTLLLLSTQAVVFNSPVIAQGSNNNECTITNAVLSNGRVTITISNGQPNENYAIDYGVYSYTEKANDSGVAVISFTPWEGDDANITPLYAAKGTGGSPTSVNDNLRCGGSSNNAVTRPLNTVLAEFGSNTTPAPGVEAPSTPPKDECADAQDKSYCRAKIACENNQNPDRCVSQKVCEELKSEGYVYTAAFEGGSAFEETKSNDASFNAYGGCFNLTDFIGTTVNYLLMFGTIIAGFMFAYASFKYLTSRGNPSELADARDMIMQTVIGLILIALAMVIVNFLTSAFGSVTPDINLMPFGG